MVMGGYIRTMAEDDGICRWRPSDGVDNGGGENDGISWRMKQWWLASGWVDEGWHWRGEGWVC